MNIVAAEREMNSLHTKVRSYNHFTENSVSDITRIALKAKLIAEEHYKNRSSIIQLEEAIGWEKDYLPLRGLTDEEERHAILKSIRLVQHGIGLWLGKE